MRALSEDPDIEVHCISYKQEDSNVQPYPTIPKVRIHTIPLSARTIKSRFREHIQMVLRLPIYPFFSLIRVWKHYKACKEICEKEKFDLVIAQYFPEDSAFAGTLLKQNGIIPKLVVIFWDNIYGMKQARFIPKQFALRRKKRAENFIAKNANNLISLYPLKPYHLQFGELLSAIGKRSYLGIPSVLPPIKPVETEYLDVVKKNRINLLYSGSIIKPQFVYKFIEILNTYPAAKKFNLIFFSRGLSSEEFDILRMKFKGTIQSPGYIPIVELLSIYNYVDAFISFPGDTRSICSKVFEYMSYGHPILILYNDPADVNVATFSKYPLCQCIDVNENNNLLHPIIDEFIGSKIGRKVPFSKVEELFVLDTPGAYTSFLKKILNAN